MRGVEEDGDGRTEAHWDHTALAHIPLGPRGLFAPLMQWLPWLPPTAWCSAALVPHTSHLYHAFTQGIISSPPPPQCKAARSDGTEEPKRVRLADCGAGLRKSAGPHQAAGPTSTTAA